MNKTIAATLLAASIASGATGAQASSGNICFYNDKKDDHTDDGKDFTGVYSCKDMETGKPTLSEHRVRGLRDGAFTKYDPRTGAVEESGTYRADKMDGLFRRYRDGVLQQEWIYAAGKREGVQKEFKNGVLSRMYLMDDQGHVDTSVHLNKTGQPTSIECKTRPIGKQDAVWCGFDGHQSSVTLFDEQGRKRAEEQYLAGKRHGLFRRYNVATGAMIEEKSYESGKSVQNGERHFDKSGTLLVKTECDPKQPTLCTDTELFDIGQKPHVVTTRLGRKVVKRLEYYQNGKMAQELVADGNRTRITDYYDSGQVRTKGTYVDAMSEWIPYLEDGTVEEYAPDGTLSSREIYVKGQLHGRAERWVKDQGVRLKEESEFDHDKLTRQKHFRNDALTDESEYFPDGSIRSHKEYPFKPAASHI